MIKMLIIINWFIHKLADIYHSDIAIVFLQMPQQQLDQRQTHKREIVIIVHKIIIIILK